ncbi:hypothetical protein IC575_019417 [Cucumis melo]
MYTCCCIRALAVGFNLSTVSYLQHFTDQFSAHRPISVHGQCAWL